MIQQSTVGERIAKANLKRAKEELTAALDKIREKSAEELRPDQKAFLRARRASLTLDDKKKYESILKEKPENKDKKK